MSVGPVLSILRWDRAEEERGGRAPFVYHLKMIYVCG